MVVEWLEPVSSEEDPWGEARPKRPDLPLLRWFSFTKWHALQLGVYAGAVAAFGFWVGGPLAVFLVMLVALRIALSSPDRGTCGHSLGVHDVRQKPHYFAGAFLLVTVAGSVATYLAVNGGTPSLNQVVWAGLVLALTIIIV